MKEILLVRNLSVILDSEEIIHDISFSVRSGEALAVIGPNGAGKTVLLCAFLGLLPYRGEIYWQKGIKAGYVPQKFAIDKTLPITVQEFFLLKAKNFWWPGKEWLLKLVHELKAVGLDESVLNKKLTDLSGGQLQRILIAFALVDHPEVLLFDEPTAGIDIGFEETIYTILYRLQKDRGTTIILISHDIGIVYRYADEVICLDKDMLCHGRRTEVLKPEDLAGIFGEGAIYKHGHGHHGLGH